MAKSKKIDAIEEEVVLEAAPAVEEAVVIEDNSIPEEEPTPVSLYDVDLCVERDVFANQVSVGEDALAYLSAVIGEKTLTVKPGVYNYSRTLTDANHVAWFRLKENCWVGPIGNIEFLGKIELPEITKPVVRKVTKNQVEVKDADALLEAKKNAIVLGHLESGFYDVLAKVSGFYKIAENQFVKADTVEYFEAPPLKALNVIVDEVLEGKWGKGVELIHSLEEAGYDYLKVKSEVDRIELEQKMIEIEPIAKEVIAGKWGIGMERNEKLRKAGHNIKLINEKVAELLAAEDDKLFKVGDNVKVLKHFDAAGRPFAILYKKYAIIEIHGKNATISKDNQTVIVNTNNLKKVK